jgi:hypothetical protein
MKRESITLTNAAGWKASIPLTRLIVLLVLAAVIVRAVPARADDVSAGFLFDQFRLTLENGFRTEAAGPFYYSQAADSGNILAFPPFFSRDDNPAVESHEDDVLYPLFTHLRYGDERRWQFCELINASSGLAPDDTTPKRVTVFPFYFQQRAVNTNLNYTAVVPFYGRLNNRLFRDEIYFIMLPGYIETRKKDVVTDNYCFPFVDVRHGDGLRGWQVWPFAGREHKDVTTQTNGFGDVTTVPGHDHSFYLWPFYFAQHNGIGTTNAETFHASIPFYAETRSPQYDATSVLWPFFTSIDNRERKYQEWQGPWPFVIFTRGEGKHTSRVWPLFSESHDDIKENDSYLWPFYTFSRTHSDPLDQQRTRILFYLYSRQAIRNTETGKNRVRLDMWPFFVWHHDFDGNERLQILAPLEPAVPDNPGIERNWSPLWSLWRAEKNPATGASSQSLLWNLYRRQTTPDYQKFSVFFGLYQSQRQPGGKSLRLFYVPVIRFHSQ